MHKTPLSLTQAKEIAEKYAEKYGKRFQVISYFGTPCAVVTDDGLQMISRGGKVAVEVLYATTEKSPLPGLAV